MHSFGPIPSEREAAFSISTVFNGMGRVRAPDDCLICVTSTEEKVCAFFMKTKKLCE